MVINTVHSGKAENSACATRKTCAEDTRGLLHPGVCMYVRLQVCSKTHEIRDIVVFERLRILNKFFDMDKQQCSVKFKF